MQIKISNIGKIKEAEVTINGITVIAGENNTGKSTVGKALYAMFNSFVDVKQRVDEERIGSLRRTLNGFANELDSFGFIKFDVKKIAVKLNEGRNELTKEKLAEVLSSEFNYGNKNLDFNRNVFEATIDKIMRILEITDESYTRTLTQKIFGEEFKQQINNTLEKEAGYVQLTIKKYVSKVYFDNDIALEVSKSIDIFNKAIYLDDPFVLDRGPVNGVFSKIFKRNAYYGHQDSLCEFIYGNQEDYNLVDKIVADERLQKIMSKMQVACKGNVFFKDNGELLYQQHNVSVPFKVANLSTGLKSFAILQTLLLNGAIKDGSLIILDEPEIHLHPGWQLLFAELIVMLQKEFNLHILLNTHSPYFLQAIEVFAEKYGIDDKCEYYLSYNDHEESFVKSVKGNLEEIYAKLARPLQVLENLRYADDK